MLDRLFPPAAWTPGVPNIEPVHSIKKSIEANFCYFCHLSCKWVCPVGSSRPFSAGFYINVIPLCIYTLKNFYNNTTQIKPRYLNGNFDSACLAEKMSWASRRTTKIRDDMAYAMLGIFGITMDVRYGEEENAFLRLEEQLVESFRDESIFAWAIPKQLNISTLLGEPSHGLLAPWASCFSGSGNFTIKSSKYKARSGVGYSIKKRGVEFDTPMLLLDHGNGVDWNNLVSSLRKNYKLGLNCWERGEREQESKVSVTISLKRGSSGQWQRIHVDALETHGSSLRRSSLIGFSKTRTMYIHHGCTGHEGWGKTVADFTDKEIRESMLK